MALVALILMLICGTMVLIDGSVTQALLFYAYFFVGVPLLAVGLE